MSFLVLTQSEVEQLLDMPGCMDAMADILEALARGELFLPLRMIAFPPRENSGIGLMPAHRAGSKAAYSLKTICLFPDNSKRGLDPHQGTVTLFSGETGELRALMNASAITEIRTAAVSGVATRLLSREDAQDLAIVGAGPTGLKCADVSERMVNRDPDVTRLLLNKKRQRRVEEFSLPVDPVAPIEEEQPATPARPSQAA